MPCSIRFGVQIILRGALMIRFLTLCFALLASGVLVPAQTPTPAPSSTDPCAEITTRAETKLKDWPALARYREANSKTATPAKDEQRVVFMGDSITDSWQNPK